MHHVSGKDRYILLVAKLEVSHGIGDDGSEEDSLTYCKLSIEHGVDVVQNEPILVQEKVHQENIEEANEIDRVDYI